MPLKALEGSNMHMPAARCAREMRDEAVSRWDHGTADIIQHYQPGSAVSRMKFTFGPWKM